MATPIDPTLLSDSSNTVLTAISQAIAGNFEITDFERAEISGLISDIARYNQQAAAGLITEDLAQQNINEAIDDVQGTIATANSLRTDTAAIAMQAGMKVLAGLIQTTLAAAFTAFKFAL